MADPCNASLAEDLVSTLDGLLGRRIVLGATAGMRRLPWVWKAVAFASTLLVLTLALGVLLGEPSAFREIDLWAGLLLVVGLIAYESLAMDVKQIASAAIIPALSPEAVTRARQWGATSFVLLRQDVVCAAVGLLTAAPLVPAMRLYLGHHGLATLLFLSFGSALITGLVYIPASASVLSLLATVGRPNLFALDPQGSPLVVGLRRLGQRTVVVAAMMATAGSLGPLLLPGLGPLAYLLAGMVFCGAVSATGAQFFVQQYAIGKLITRARGETLSALQHEIAPLFERRMSLSDHERSTLDSLLVLYDRVLHVSAQGFTLREGFRFLRPLLVPAVTLILTSFHIELPSRGPIGALLRQILQL